MAHKKTVLLVGATGMFGQKLAKALIERKDVIPKLLVHDHAEEDPEKKYFIEVAKQDGAEIAYGDVMAPKSLLMACQGVDVIISAVGNTRDQIITGQTNLLDAAEKLGIERFVPSDYSVDYFNLDEGDNFNMDMRKRFAGTLMKSKVPYTIPLTGAFTEIQFSDWGTLFDFEDGIFSYWGDGETPVDLTTMDDAARFTVAAALDPEMANRKLRIAGDVITMKGLHQLFNMITGQNFKEVRLGNLEELEQYIVELRGEAQSPAHYLPYQYHYALVSGVAKLDPLDNRRYPELSPMSAKEYIQQKGYDKLSVGDVHIDTFRNFRKSRRAA